MKNNEFKSLKITRFCQKLHSFWQKIHKSCQKNSDLNNIVKVSKNNSTRLYKILKAKYVYILAILHNEIISKYIKKSKI